MFKYGIWWARWIPINYIRPNKNDYVLGQHLARLFQTWCTNCYINWTKKMSINRLGSICVKTILKDCGFPGIWGSQVIPYSKECFKQQIKQRLFHQLRQKWAAEINQSSKCLNYRMCKSNFKIEHYLTITDDYLRDSVAETTTFQL